MRKLILHDEITCIGCDKCMHACPMKGASITYTIGGQLKVQVKYRCRGGKKGRIWKNILRISARNNFRQIRKHRFPDRRTVRQGG
jgi:Fe-S-cluster-containing hydrogenase component 2